VRVAASAEWTGCLPAFVFAHTSFGTVPAYLGTKGQPATGVESTPSATVLTLTRAIPLRSMAGSVTLAQGGTGALYAKNPNGWVRDLRYGIYASRCRVC
jgi:hypothetical protein